MARFSSTPITEELAGGGMEFLQVATTAGGMKSMCLHSRIRC